MPALWWLLSALLLLVIEMITPGLFYFACLGGGALLAAAAVGLGAGPGLSWGVFFAGSTLLVLLVAPLARRWLRRLPASPVGLDAMTGQRAHVLEALDPATGKGLVRLESGARWRAVAKEAIPAGTWVEILGVTGTRLRVRNLSTPPTKE